MRYRVPHESIEFDIPDDWLDLAGASGFVPSQTAFVASSNPEWPTTLVRITNVAAPRRDAGVLGLRKDRTVSILRAFLDGTELPPLEVHEPPEPRRFRFRVLDGFHRYSIAAGFSMLPVSIRPYFDFNAL
jgi:hypothetical protein